MENTIFLGAEGARLMAAESLRQKDREVHFVCKCAILRSLELLFSQQLFFYF